MRDVRGQYKRTIVGQFWSLLNPLALMLIYTFVFRFVFRTQPQPGDPSGIDFYALWLLCGLLPWIFFSTAVVSGMGSIISNAGLVQKVYFARLVLPIAAVSAAVYNWLFEMTVLFIALLLFGSQLWIWLPMALVAMALLALFASGLAMALSIANVHFRDTQYLVGVILSFWIFLTPIMYPTSLVLEQSERIGPLLGTHLTVIDIYRLNPMERFVEVFRNLLYDNRWPASEDFVFILLAAFISFTVGMWIFAKNERRLAEVL